MLDGLAQRREGLALALDAVEVVGDALLVEGVGGDAVFGDPVHLLGADLQLGALAAKAHDRRVDRAVVVVLGDRDVVLEPAGHDLPVGVDDAERAVAVGDRRDDDAEADHVGELLERDLLAIDLGGDRPRRLQPRRHPGVDALVLELLRELALDRLDGLGELGLHLGETAGDRDVVVGLERLEREVLELAPHVLHAHPARQRGIDVHRLLGDAAALFGRHEVEGPHVVETVGEFDEQHPDVGRDREEKLPQVLGLGFLAGDEVQPLDLRKAVDDGADLVAEQLVDLGAGRVGVLDRVVEESDGDRRVVELELREDGGDFERMGEVGVAGGTLLLAVLLHGVNVGPVEQLVVRLRVIGLHPLDQLVLTHHRGAALPGGLVARPSSANEKGAGRKPGA